MTSLDKRVADLEFHFYRLQEQVDLWQHLCDRVAALERKGG